MIYFVGIHHKKGLPALCSTTRSGKKIDDVIARLDVPCEKVNLFSTEYIPERWTSDEYIRECEKFYDRVPQDGCTIVLLGRAVSDHFPYGIYRQ